MSVGAQDADIGREGTGFGGVGNAGQALCVRVSGMAQAGCPHMYP